jgi:N-acetylneuraminate synthase/sialic acid synthase
MIISTGGASIKKIEQIYDLVSQYHDNFAFLHCVSTYPNIDCQLNLEVIETLRVMFPNILIGFSSHHSGILPLVIARTLGASIIEVHFTMNRSWRGTDHGFSIEPKGLTQLVEDIHRVSVMIGNGDKEVLSEEISGFVKKLGKGIYVKRPMKAGERIGKHDL